MQLSREFDVTATRARACEVLAEDATLTSLFPDTKTDIVARTARRRTARSVYRLLGQAGEATFHFDTQDDGSVRFAKVCDGRVWKELSGRVTLKERGTKLRVRIEMEGKTKGFVPEFTIKAPLQKQLDDMASALKRRMELCLT
jgi:carbon monoxide dehydrogenase subunit G